MALQHLRSSTANKRPDPTAMAAGQLALNNEATSPGLFFKDSGGNLVKVGPVHVGTTAPNATPAAGGTAGNSLGEQWLDTSGSSYVFKVWDGSAWRSEAGEFVNASGDTMTGALVMDNQQQVRFRETTANGTNYIAIQAPASVTSDQTLTLPEATGTLVSTGDSGTVTSTMIADGTIVNGDINASAAIAGTKISPDFGSQNVTTTGTVSGASLNPTSSTIPTNGIYVPATNAIGISTAGVIRQSISGTGSVTYVPVTVQGAVTGDSFVPTSSTVPTNGVYLPATNSVAISTNGSGRLFVDSSGQVGIGQTSIPTRLSVVSFTPTSSNLDAVFNVTNDIDSNFRVFVTGSGVADKRAAIGPTTSSSLAFVTNSTERARIDSSGRVGIGTTSPTSTLHVVGGAAVIQKSGDASNPRVILEPVSGGPQKISGYGDGDSTEQQLAFHTGLFGSEAMRIDSSGRLLVGTSSAFGGGKTQVANGNIDIGAYAGAVSGSYELIFSKSRSATVGSETIVANGDTLGQINFRGSDGSSQVPAAYIYAQVDGTPGTNDMPGRLVFSVTSDGSASPTEALRISQDRAVSIGGISGSMVSSGGYLYVQRQSDTVGFFNRNTNDGTIIDFRQDNVSEGSISVSGTTVSYNGAHLSRWTQLPGGAERTEILRGTVLSNIDEMCEWGDEENEQLNRMKVSDVEGDKNVSGVFQAWDDDDDTYTNDFYCAMTGDFIIRIAEGVTVECGDLLMSAGDGTAKPQDDDIIRSKTIAKVTSTNVSCTYDDGSYCVPCVLMAC